MTVQDRKCRQDRISDFLDKRLSDSEQLVFEEHLSECSACRQSLGAQTADDELWDKASRYLRDDESEPSPLSWASISSAEKENSLSHIQCVLDALQPTDDPVM